GTGYGFQLTDNSNGGYPSQAAYFAYGVSFRTYTATNTATANGTKINIGFSTSDKALYYNMRFEKK
ncbi:MAG: hypothetical protein LBT25_10615, partial [Candidatus Symbiothrix sp.]|nr:hypothetical protein [Candidatus Symbiothrix sp.]